MHMRTTTLIGTIVLLLLLPGTIPAQDGESPLDLAIELRRKGRYTDAQARLAKGRAAAPKDAALAAEQAELCLETGRYADAEKAARSVAADAQCLALAGESFDVFITVDLNLPDQQNLGSGIEVITLAAPTNRLQDLEPLVPALLDALSTIRKGQLVRLGG